MYRQYKEPATLIQKSLETAQFRFLREAAKKWLGIATYFHHCSTLSCLMLWCRVCSSLPSLWRLSFIKCDNHFLPRTENNKREQGVFRLVLFFLFKHTHKKLEKGWTGEAYSLIDRLLTIGFAWNWMYWTSQNLRTSGSQVVQTYSTCRIPQKWTVLSQEKLSLKCHHGIKMLWQLALISDKLDLSNVKWSELNKV